MPWHDHAIFIDIEHKARQFIRGQSNDRPAVAGQVRPPAEKRVVNFIYGGKGRGKNKVVDTVTLTALGINAADLGGKHEKNVRVLKQSVAAILKSMF